MKGLLSDSGFFEMQQTSTAPERYVVENSSNFAESKTPSNKFQVSPFSVDSKQQPFELANTLTRQEMLLLNEDKSKPDAREALKAALNQAQASKNNPGIFSLSTVLDSKNEWGQTRVYTFMPKAQGDLKGYSSKLVEPLGKESKERDSVLDTLVTLNLIHPKG